MSAETHQNPDTVAATGAGAPGPSTSIARLRNATPLTHCITNFVSMDVAANALIAAGAAPAMIHAIEEAAEFARVADALAVNIGTLDAAWLSAMSAAAEAASAAGKPWVLDPVAVGATSFRRDAAARLTAFRPTIIRGNASEILALAEGVASGRGVDASDETASVEAAATALAARTGAVVAMTGPLDYVTDGTRKCWVAGGSPMMTQVTALGCALSALCAAYAATGPDRLETTAAALAHYAVAGAAAAETASGPGAFRAAFIDALAAVDDDAVAASGVLRRGG